MDGKISEIIDNVLDTDDYLNNNKTEDINSVNSWNEITYLDKTIFKKEKNELPSPIKDDKFKEKYKRKEINKNCEPINKITEKKILNENLFKGKGFRTNIDFFLKTNSENLSLSGITDITSLADHPNIFKCNNPRVGTNRYKKANKTNDTFYNSFYIGNGNKTINNINCNMNLSTNSVNRKNLPKIKNQIEERKIPINKVVISAKNKKK
jgi:hypothetical protein